MQPSKQEVPTMAMKVKKFDDKILDQLMKNYTSPEYILEEGGLLIQLKKAILKRVN